MNGGPAGKTPAVRPAGRTAVRYVLAGGVNTAIGLAVSTAALHAGWPWPCATALGFAAGWVTGFFLSRHFTFKSRLPHRTVLPRYAFAVLAAYGLAGLAGSETAGLAERLLASAAPMLAAERETLAVWLCNGYYAVFNYAGQRWLVFRH